MEYKKSNGACIPQRVHTVVISVQHREDITLDEMKVQLKEKIVKVTIHNMVLWLYSVVATLTDIGSGSS